MLDLITDEEIGKFVTKSWTDYIRGLINLEDFKSEVMFYVADARGFNG